MKTLITVVGSTATGKTDISLLLAKYFQTSILSCDSRQCYQELNIGTAKPSLEEMQGIPHFFIHTHSIHDNITVQTFSDYAEKTLSHLFEQQDVVVAVGGSGMFWDSLFFELNPIPHIDPYIRDEIKKSFLAKGIIWLQNTVATEDVIYAKDGEMKNPQRMMRALEVKRGTGKSIRHFQFGKQQKQQLFKTLHIGLAFSSPEIRLKRITMRVENMLQQGLENEAKQFETLQHLNALQTHGYREWWNYFLGKISKEEAIQHIISDTNSYAKRQMTWFKRYKDIHWFSHQTDKADIVKKVISLL